MLFSVVSLSNANTHVQTSPRKPPKPSVLSSFPEQTLVLLVLNSCCLPVSDMLTLLASVSLCSGYSQVIILRCTHPDVSSCWHPKHTGHMMGGFTPALALRPKHTRAPAERAPSLRTTAQRKFNEKTHQATNLVQGIDGSADEC